MWTTSTFHVDSSVLQSHTSHFSPSISPFPVPFFPSFTVLLPLSVQYAASLSSLSNSRGYHILHHQYWNLRPTPSLALPFPLKSLYIKVILSDQPRKKSLKLRCFEKFPQGGALYTRHHLIYSKYKNQSIRH